MLKIIRKKGIIKTLIWIVAILIILSFGLFGTAYLVQDYNRKKYAGEIFDRKIPIEVFQKHFQTVNVNSLIQYGDKYYDVRQYLNLPGQTWDRLILLREADKQNIQVSDQDVIQAIEQYPFFRKNDQFDESLYQKIVTNVFKTTPRAFEEGMRDSLRVSKMFDDLFRDIKVSDEDVFDAFKRKQEKIQVSYLMLGPADFKDTVSVSDENVTAFFNEKKLDFILPESIDVEYVQIEFPENAAENGKTTVRQESDDLMTQLSGGAPDDILKAKNLSLQKTGFFSRENPKTDLGWPLETLNTIFDLSAGEWLGPFENNKAVFLARLKERKDAYLPELSEITSKVKEALITQKALESAKNKTAENLSLIQTKLAAGPTPDFSAWGKELGLEAVQTPAFVRGQYLPKIGIAPEFQEAAFKLSAERPLSEAVNTDQGSFILFFDSYTPPDQEEFAKVKDKIGQEFIAMKKNEMFSTLLSKLRAQANFKDYTQNED